MAISTSGIPPPPPLLHMPQYPMSRPYHPLPPPVVKPASQLHHLTQKVDNTRQQVLAHEVHKSKIGKAIKKVKRRLGLAGRGSATGHGGSGGTNNLPRLLFHQVHGENIRISAEGRIARREESFCRGVTFSARPVKIGERVCVRFLEISNSWSGVIRFGFTSNDPSTLRYNLPKYACPDLTNKPGYWAKALAERLCEKDTVMFYYVTAAGDVLFGVNGEEKGVFFSGVDTRSQLWAMIDVYGNSTAIELLDYRAHLNNRSRPREDPSISEIERAVVPAMASMSLQGPSGPAQMPVQPPEIPEGPARPPLPRPLPSSSIPQVVRHFTASPRFQPVPLHPVRGKNLRLSEDLTVATRRETQFSGGYAFCSRPLVVGEQLVVQVLTTQSVYLGGLAMGLTSANPSELAGVTLPDDSDLLLDRPEYWVVSKDVAGTPEAGDELLFMLTASGAVTMAKNGGHPVTLMHVDHSLTLWPFFDVYGSTQRIRVFSSNPYQRDNCLNRVAVASEVRPSVSSPPAASHGITVNSSSGVGGATTVLVVNLPPPQAVQSHAAEAHAYHTNHTYIEPISNGDSSPASRPSPRQLTLLPPAGGELPQSSDCTVCYERQIDSVLYTCGHMCMCYECAVQQWRGIGGGHCPFCRAPIRDVIRTFRS